MRQPAKAAKKKNRALQDLHGAIFFRFDTFLTPGEEKDCYAIANSPGKYL